MNSLVANPIPGESFSFLPNRKVDGYELTPGCEAVPYSLHREDGCADQRRNDRATVLSFGHDFGVRYCEPSKARTSSPVSSGDQATAAAGRDVCPQRASAAERVNCVRGAALGPCFCRGYTAPDDASCAIAPRLHSEAADNGYGEEACRIGPGCCRVNCGSI